MDESYSTGTVSYFDDAEGVGVIESSDTPAGCWCHYSMIEGVGRRTLVAGERVFFTFVRADQDGHAFRAVRVRRAP